MEFSEYTIREGFTVQVCAIIVNGTAARDVAFTFTPGGGSASGKVQYIHTLVMCMHT